jgi:preprotein translocase subunit YajC
MMQRIIEQPWLFMAFVVLIAVLWFAASRRVRRDRLRKHQSRVDRRNAIRAQRDRRWRARE